MRKKVLSMLTAIAVFITVLPQNFALADGETYPVIKFGIASGDNVFFGSNTTEKYTAPQKFLVLDADKSSTGDTDGAFLITSDVTSQSVHRSYTVSTLMSECTDFLEIFNADEQNLITPTTKNSTAEISGYSDLKETITDQKIFPISAGEATEYADLLKLTNGKNWSLRSSKKSYTLANGNCLYAGYVNTDNKLAVDVLSYMSSKSYAFRPAMNISKSTASVSTPFGNKILLLPSNNTETGKLTSAYSDSKQDFILPVKDSEISAVKSVTTRGISRNYDLTVTTSGRTTVSDNEYITFIVTDINSENIMYFGRYKKTGETSDITVTLPNTVLPSNCKVYAFNEVYTPGNVSKISALTEVCLTHNYTYSDNGNGTHKVTCTNCGYTENKNHAVTYTSVDGSKHRAICGLCKNETDSAHNLSYKKDGNGHRQYCTDCGYEETEKTAHTFTCKSLGASGHINTCNVCGYEERWSHGFSDSNITDNGDNHTKTCIACGYKETDDHSYNNKWTDNGDNHIKKCTLCGHIIADEHNFSDGKYTAVDSKSHKAVCSVCNAEKESAHDFEYIAKKDGTHTKVCKECGLEFAEKHTFVYTEQGSILKPLTCSVCNGDLGVKASAHPLTGDYSKRLSAVDLSSAELSLGSKREDCLPSDIFNEGNDFYGAGVPISGTEYSVNVDFAMTHPVALTGFSLKLGSNAVSSPRRIPKYITISGKNDADSEYTAIATISTENFIRIENWSVSMYFLTYTPSAYKYYRLSFVNNNSEIQLCTFTPFTAKGSEVEFDLSGVLADKKHDLIVPNEEYECTLISKDGHPSSVTVTADGKDFTDFTYSAESGILHIDGDKVTGGKYKISASAQNTPVNVTTDLYRLTFDGAGTALFGENYVGNFWDNDKKRYNIPTSADDIKITIGGKNFADFIYNRAYGQIEIPGKNITGDIVIKAAEKGSIRQDNSVAVVKKQNDVERYYPSFGEVVSKISGTSGAEVKLLADVNGQYEISNSKSNIDLGGFDINGSTVFNIFSSDLTFENGTVTADQNGFVLYGGDFENNANTITLGKNFKLNSNGNGVFLYSGTALIADGAEIYGKNSAIFTNDEKCSLIVKSGTFKGTVKMTGRKNNVELSGGTFDSLLLGSDMSYISALADGYAYKSASEEKRTIAEMFGNGSLDSFSVEKSPFAYSKEEKQVDFGYANPVQLTVQADAENYQWFVNGEIIDGAVNSTYTIETGLESGKYEYICVAEKDNLYAPVKKVSFTVYCAHENLDANGKCANCQSVFQAVVTNKNESHVYCKTVFDAANTVKANGEIKLITDITVPEEDILANDESLILSEKNITFNLNGKSISSSESEKTDGLYLTIYDFATVKNGTLNIDVYIPYDGRGAVLENLTVTGYVTVQTENVKILSGNYARLDCAGYLINFIEDGKALKTADGWADLEKAFECENVSVVPAPFNFTKQPQSIHIKDTDYTDGGTISVEAEKISEYENEEITYQWYEYNGNGSSEPIDGETNSTFKIPTGIEDGISKTYYCIVSCDGYSKSSGLASIAVGDIKPDVDITPSPYDWTVSVYGNGLTGDIVIAGYDENGNLTGISFDELTAENENEYNTTVFDGLGFSENCKTVKVFLFDKFKNMSPLCPNAEQDITESFN